MQNLIDGVIRELEQRNYFEAIKYCNQLIAQFPKNYVFYEIRGNCYLETGSFVAAIQNYTEALEFLQPTDSKSKSDIASLYNRRGYARLKLNLFSEAINDFKKSVEFKPDFAEAYNNCGNAYRKLEKYDEAMIQCNRAIECRGDFAEAYNNRGNIFYLFSKDNEAIRDYTKAIELNPNYTGAYYNRGVAYYYLQNKLVEAKEDWLKVIKMNPSYEKELQEKIDKINNALELTHGEISQPLSLVQKDENIEHEDEVIESPEEVKSEEKHEEPVLERYEEPSQDKKTEEHKVEGVEEKTEETIEEKTEEPVKEKTEEPVIEKTEERIEEKKEEPIEEKTVDTKSEEIEIPEIDFKSIFQESEKEKEFEDEIKPLAEIFEEIYNPKEEKEVIPEEVKKLHEEIETVQSVSEQEEIPSVEQTADKETPKEIVLPEEPKKKEKYTDSARLINPIYEKEIPEKSIFKSPMFIIPLVFIILLILSVSSYLLYNKIYTKKQQTNKQDITAVSKDTVKTSANIDSSQIKDTTAVKTSKTEVKEEDKQKEKKEEKVENTPPSVTTIKNFVVIKEKEGIYLQVASLKEKSSADTKTAALNKKGVTAKVIEADLGAKGKYYRVRVGPFKSIEEAKTAADKID